MENLDAVVQAVLERIFVPVEASGRHVHLTREQARTLFGHDLTQKKPLSQPGQYLSGERVRVVGPKGEFRDVAVLGPARKEAQVEISLTDGRTLGLQPPVRLSGDVSGSPGCILEGPCGTVELKQGGHCGPAAHSPDTGRWQALRRKRPAGGEASDLYEPAGDF